MPFGGSADVLTTSDLTGEDEEEDTQIYAKKDAKLYGKEKDRKDKFVSIPFMKKYIHLAKAIRVILSFLYLVSMIKFCSQFLYEDSDPLFCGGIFLPGIDLELIENTPILFAVQFDCWSLFLLAIVSKPQLGH